MTITNLSLDNTSHPGRPGPDELVPSRYASDVYKWPLNVVVVRSGGRTVLIDAGIGVEYPDFPRSGQLALRLDAAGIDPASVTDVATLVIIIVTYVAG